MLLTLENIQNQQFNQRFRGYDMAEVDAFLDKIAESYLFLTTENGKLKEELKAIKNERNQSLEEEQHFKNAIISAQSFADDIKTKAEKRAARLAEDAKEKSTAILEEAQNEVDTLQSQISSLAGEKERLKGELRSFLNTCLARIDEDGPSVASITPPPVVDMDQIPEFMEEPEPTTVAAEPELAMKASPLETSSEEEDVAILYEKIDLDEDFNQVDDPKVEPSEPPAAMAMKIGNEDIPDFSTDELDDLDLPDDLDGDMLYSLEDPLDIPGPAVVIDPLDDDKTK